MRQLSNQQGAKHGKNTRASPFVFMGDEYQHTRIVLKADYYGTDHVEYIVHDHCIDENGTTSYGNGRYYPASKDPLQRAWTEFMLRSNLLMDKVLDQDDRAVLSDLNGECFSNLGFNVRGKG